MRLAISLQRIAYATNRPPQT